MKSSSDKNYYTTTEVANMLHIAPRTVTIWFDKGILQGWKYPDSGTRRIDKNSLIAFIRKNKIRCDVFGRNLCATILLYSLQPEFNFNLHVLPNDEFVVVRTTSPFHAGMILATETIHVAILDCMMGRSDCLSIGKHIYSETNNVLTIGIINDDEISNDFSKENGFDLLTKRPFPPDTITNFIMENKDGFTEVPKVKGKSRDPKKGI